MLDEHLFRIQGILWLVTSFARYCKPFNLGPTQSHLGKGLSNFGLSDVASWDRVEFLKPEIEMRICNVYDKFISNIDGIRKKHHELKAYLFDIFLVFVERLYQLDINWCILWYDLWQIMTWTDSTTGLDILMWIGRVERWYLSTTKFYIELDLLFKPLTCVLNMLEQSKHV